MSISSAALDGSAFDIEPPVIYGLEHQCRALSPHYVYDDMSCRFVVGTQSLRSENLVYIFEYTDETNNLTKMAFRHTNGEIWHIACSYKNPELLTTVHNMPGCTQKISVLKFPYDVTGTLADEDNIPALELSVEADVVQASSNKPAKGLAPQCLWHPEDGARIAYCNDGALTVWNVETQEPEFTQSLSENTGLNTDEGRYSVATLRWSPNCNCNVIAASRGPHVVGIDTRQSSQKSNNSSNQSWLIQDAHSQYVRSIDFNPNSQYYLITGGDDCKTKFWDLRNLKEPSLMVKNHSHWVWCVRYNPYHDQLVLSAGSDHRATLYRVQSIASDPFGHMNPGEIAGDEDGDLENEEESADLSKIEHKVPQGDAVINVYEDHDDAIYAAEWGTDPWVFATLGFESRIVFNKVPKQEKFNILF